MTTEKIRIPDFGDVQKITVVEVFVAAGDKVEVETPLVAMESEKAVMDLPSPLAGVIKEVLIKADDEVKSGDVIAVIETAGEGAPEKDAPEPIPVKKTPEDVSAAEEVPVAAQAREAEQARPPEPTGQPAGPAAQPAETAAEGAKGRTFHATPSVRAFAREQGVDLGRVEGTGPHGRILKEDVQVVMAGGKGKKAEAAPAGPGAMPPLEDFSKYGPVEEIELSRIQKMSGPHLLRSWLAIPHVTHFDEADITELDAFRRELNAGLLEGQASYSPLHFVIKAVAANLQRFPLCNSSLHPDGDRVIHKKYCHLGIAVDTPHGLVVPVIKDADRKGLREVADELQRLSGAARAGKLAIPDIQGASFTISSLGGIGGTGFTPIVSHPQVAILGVSRSAMKPVWDGQQFVPRLILPFSLSYDHRVIDGAEAARFCRRLAESLADLRRILL